MRTVYALMAALVCALAASDSLSPLSVLAIAAVGGLIRPSDLGLRNVLIGQVLPARQLMSAIGLARLTVDTARIGGALMGAGAVIAIGLVRAYGAVLCLYAVGIALLLAIRLPPRPAGDHLRPDVSPWRNLWDGIRAVWGAPAQLAAMVLAFLANLTAYPFLLGLLPFLARDVYGTGEKGLGYLVAAAGVGAVIGSLILSRFGATVWPARMMLSFSLIWHLLVIALGLVDGFAAGLIVLVFCGAASMLCLLPITVLLLRAAPPAMHGRIMGIRTQAVYGLPLGLLISGPLIERFGFAATACAYGSIGALATLLILLKWRDHLWPAGAAANRG